MWESVMDYAIATNIGIFGLLFVALLVSVSLGIKWIFNKNDEREQRYINVIEKQADALKSIDSIQNDIKEVKEHIIYRRG